MKNNGTIVFVTGSKTLTGADFSMISFIKKLKKENYDVVVLINGEGRTTDYYRKNNINYVVVPFKTWYSHNNNKILSFILKFYKNIYNIFSAMFFSIKFKNLKNVKLIYNNGFTNNFSYYLSIFNNKKLLYHMREFGDLDFGWNFVAKNKIVQYNKIEHKVDLFIAISEAVKESFDGVNNYDKISVVYNGVEVKNNEKKTHDNNIIKIVIVGRLSKEKGHIVLLKAMKELIDKKFNNIVLDIYGDGEEKENILSFISSNGLQKYVYLKGFKSDINLSDYDIGIMASVAEAFGRVTVEYMMSGLVTIAADSGANPEIINNYENGLLFSQGNAFDLANKIIDVVSNKNLMKKIKTNGQKTAREKFSESNYVNNLFKLLKSKSLI